MSHLSQQSLQQHKKCSSQELTHLTQQQQKRLTINDNMVEANLSIIFDKNSILLCWMQLRVRVSTPNCQSKWDAAHFCSHLSQKFSAMLQRLHASSATSQHSHKTTATSQRLHKKLCLRLSKLLKIHREQEARLKVCPKCFFTTLLGAEVLGSPDDDNAEDLKSTSEDSIDRLTGYNYINKDEELGGVDALTDVYQDILGDTESKEKSANTN